ncbi:serine/threonine-protein kinase [Blastococcus sp. URHD0036]|uniref:serine/threonine-protein kinase n=1 Tax=Blastococcus sp. URHD0036 TaxID=1380356 RepID=UPI000690FF46|nr:serine/threonine-protein kinase [Blastococcus sp. URHD0036]
MHGATFGPYRLLGPLGRGGMGEVHRAWDTEHERVVALKLLTPHLAADEGYRARFQREARLTARLRGPHVVPIHRYGEIDGRLFLDMRLVEGEDLASRLARWGPLPLATALSVVGQLAEALDAAHADGLVHRDVKPSNVLLTGRPDDPFVYLVDFGIARSSQDGAAITQTGTAIGSYEYMAPERFVTGSDVDPRVDVYALACVLYECLTGIRAFPSSSLPSAYHAHLHTEPAPLWARRADVPPALDAVLRRALARDPARRTATAGQLVAEARRAVAAPVAAAPGPTGAPRVTAAPVPRPASRPPVAVPAPTPRSPTPLLRPVPRAAAAPTPAAWPTPPAAPPRGPFPPAAFPPPSFPPRPAPPVRRRRPVLALLVAAFFVALVAFMDRADADYPAGVAVGFGLTALASEVLLGLSLSVRDALDRAGGLPWVLGAIAVGTLVLADQGSGASLAGPAAFAGAQVADLVVWRLVRPGLGWRAALVASNLVGAVAYTTVQVAAGATGEMGGAFLATAATTVLTWVVAEVLRPLVARR